MRLVSAKIQEANAVNRPACRTCLSEDLVRIAKTIDLPDGSGHAIYPKLDIARCVTRGTCRGCDCDCDEQDEVDEKQGGCE